MSPSAAHHSLLSQGMPDQLRTALETIARSATSITSVMAAVSLSMRHQRESLAKCVGLAELTRRDVELLIVVRS